MRIRKLSENERPAGELLLLAKSVAAHGIDPTGGLVPLDLPAIRARWQKTHSKLLPRETLKTFKTAPAFRGASPDSQCHFV